MKPYDISSSKYVKEIIEFANKSSSLEDLGIKSIPEVLAEQINPVLDNQNKIINNLIELNNKKEHELEETKTELIKTKKYNRNMMWITIASVLVGVGSLIATVVLGTR